MNYVLLSLANNNYRSSNSFSFSYPILILTDQRISDEEIDAPPAKHPMGGSQGMT